MATDQKKDGTDQPTDENTDLQSCFSAAEKENKEPGKGSALVLEGVEVGVGVEVRRYLTELIRM